MAAAVGAAPILEFGRFKVLPGRREVLADGKPLDIGDRAFDVLMVLLEARGALVTKDEILQRAWPRQVVEENTLQAQISALRRALGADRELIRTVAGRGYQFIGELRPQPQEDRRPSADTNIGERASELIGRGPEIATVLNLADAHRVVTLSGPGGIGKTRLAEEAARAILSRGTMSVWIAKLAPVTDPALVPASVASALGLTFAAGPVSARRIAAELGRQPMLLVLDNCEHVIQAAAELADALLRGTPSVRILATSREPLGCEGEQVYRVPALDLPPSDDRGSVLASGAVKLFIARARESDASFAPEIGMLSTIAAVCRRLDGIPLALELAACRAAALGIETLAARLDDRFRLLTGGKRTAMARHRTLLATFDWSHDLLAEPERAILRRLAVFPAAFPLAAAARVAAGSDFTDAELVEGLAALVAKSLVVRDHASGWYRLLVTTRAYAREKLTAAGELDEFARRHAEHCRDLFAQAEHEWETEASEVWLARYQRHLDCLRAALDWGFAPEGDESIALSLVAAAVPLWFLLSLFDECRGRVEQALERLERSGGENEPLAMRLHAAHGYSRTTGPMRETATAWSKVLALAERLQDTDYRLRALWGLWAGAVDNGEFGTTLQLAVKFCSAAEASREPADRLVGERMTAQSLHFRGDQSRALSHIEHMLRRYEPPAIRPHIVRFQFDQRVAARITLARALWLCGRPEQALQTVHATVHEAVALKHSLSLGAFLAYAACPVALLAGTVEEAERYFAMFVEHTARNAPDVWRSYGRCVDGMLRLRRGEAVEAVERLREGVPELRRASFTQYHTAFVLALAEALARTGALDEGLAAVDDAIARAQQTEEGWCLAEMLRLRGELVIAPDGDESAAEDLFRRSLDLARTQGALSWELRTAASLARQRQRQGRPAEGHALLAPVFARFTEGHATPDVAAARELLGELR